MHISFIIFNYKINTKSYCIQISVNTMNLIINAEYNYIQRLLVGSKLIFKKMYGQNANEKILFKTTFR